MCSIVFLKNNEINVFFTSTSMWIIKTQWQIEFVSVLPGTIIKLKNNTDTLVCDSLVGAMWMASGWDCGWIMWTFFDYIYTYKAWVTFDNRYSSDQTDCFEGFLLWIRLSYEIKGKQRPDINLAEAANAAFNREKNAK